MGKSLLCFIDPWDIAHFRSRTDENNFFTDFMIIIFGD